MASQRHASKCLLTRPPGRIVFDENDLAIFEIGEEKVTMQQRLYIESLHRLTRLFDVSSIRTDPNEHSYYILCRRDPMVSPFQVKRTTLMNESRRKHRNVFIDFSSSLFVSTRINQMLVTLVFPEVFMSE